MSKFDKSEKNPDLGIINIKGIKSDSVQIDKITIEAETHKEETDIAAALIASIAGSKDAIKQTVDAARSQIKLSFVIEKYKKEKKNGDWTAGTLKEFNGILNCLGDILEDLPMSAIGYPETNKVKDILVRLPPNRRTGKYKNLTIKQVLAMKPKKTLQKKTINKYLGLFSNLFDYAERHGFCEKNYFRGMGLKITKKPHEERAPFTQEDLGKLFSPLNFRPDKFRFSYCYLVPLLALYTGARIEELCQLRLEDIKQVDGIWVIDINKNGDRTVKTQSSERQIPIHDELIRLGLLKYATSLKKRRRTKIFPELEKNKRGRYSARVSKWFNDRYRPKCGVVEKGKVFHSFRHLVDDHLKQKDIEIAKIKAILGHKDNDVTSGRYGNPYGVKILKPIIEELDFQLPPILPFI